MNRIIQALQVKDIRKRLFFMLICMIVIRFGAQIPCPGVSSDYFAEWFRAQGGNSFNLINAFTGGSFERMSILALSITPYITASIIIELLSIAIPALEEMQRDGEEGRKKMTAISRYLTVGLSVMESAAMCIGFGNQGLIPNMTFLKGAAVVTSMTAGSCFLMWVGEQITEYGIGNGISIVLLINIVSRIPQDIAGLVDQFVKGKTIAKGLLAALIIAAVIFLVVALVVILNGAARKIPVQYSRKIAGSKYQVGGTGTNIPLKVNTAGVIPVIFASSIMSFPGIIAAFARKTPAWLGFLSESNWFDRSRPIYTIGVVLYVVLVIFFAYFYTSITFNPREVADNLRKSGGVVPGIRPGAPTELYLRNILRSIIFIGATGLALVAVIPIVINGIFSAHASFGGTSLIIIVGVILETVQQIEAMMAVHNYKGFLAEGGNNS